MSLYSSFPVPDSDSQDMQWFMANVDFEIIRNKLLVLNRTIKYADVHEVVVELIVRDKWMNLQISIWDILAILEELNILKHRKNTYGYEVVK